MPQFVESVQPAWRVHRDGPRDYSGGEFWGRRWVGARVAEWVLAEAEDDVVAVRHPGCRGPLAAILGAAPEPQCYRVQVVRATTAYGGVRTWWECPGCRRQCGLLFLVAGRDRLGCRVCCRLVYRSQYRPRSARRRRAGGKAVQRGRV